MAEQEHGGAGVDVAALRALLAKATPGPWRCELDDDSVVVLSPDHVAAGLPPYACETDIFTDAAPADRALIAAMHTALPTLLDELATLRAALEWYAAPTTWRAGTRISSMGSHRASDGENDAGSRARAALTEAAR